VPDFERELDELYALPADEFTAARNELAKRLRAAGQKDEADAVKALRKPGVSAALVNRLARERAKQVGVLLEAGESLREAHSRGGDALRKAAEAERKAVDELVGAARRLDPDASDATLGRVGSTLRAAAGDPEARPLLERGRLTADVEPGGFDALAGIAIAAPLAPGRGGAGKGGARKAGAAASAPKRDRRKLEEARGKVKELRAQAREASRAAAHARLEADRAEREAARGERELRQAEERLARLED
jgi:hypothetical protein